jgi:DNA mismatch repair protein MutS2
MARASFPTTGYRLPTTDYFSPHKRQLDGIIPVWWFMDAFTLEKIEFDAVRRILAGFCRTSLGKDLARHISAANRLDVVRKRLDETSQMVEVVRDVGLPPMGGVTDVREALRRAAPGGGAGAEDYAAVASTLDGVTACLRFLRDLPEPLHLLHEQARHLGDFTPEILAIRAVVGPEGGIRDDASPRLRQLRSEIDEVTRNIHDIVHNYVRNPEIRKLLQSPNVTLHGDRYVLPVKADNRGRLPGVVHRASHTGATVFVEPNASVELNNRLVDLHDHERQEIERLLADLAVCIAPRRDAMSRALQAMAYIDLLSAKAQYAYQYDMVCPTITPNGTLELYQARHPLIEAAAIEAKREGRAVQAVVPIDVRLGGDFDILVLTGSNTGGKTVTLKTVALCVVMAQSGLHVPARRGAALPLVRDVLIEIGDEQSLEQSLSTFGGHVQRLKAIFAGTRRDTLVLLDELGSGTDPDEGGAIGQAVLDELRRIGCLAMVTTHFSVLKAYALNHDRVDNASVEFDTKTLRPTYHLHIGTPGESHAITVAERLGLPKRIIEAARRHASHRGGQFAKAMRRTGAARRQAEEARAEAAAAEIKAQTRAERLEEQFEDVEQFKGEFAAWLARLAELKPGDSIFVPSMKRNGTLARLETHRQVAVVDFDNLQREIPITELMPDLGQAEVRAQIRELRREVQDQFQTAAEETRHAQTMREEAQRQEQYHKTRAKQFDAWLGAIARVKPGHDVPIAVKPGRGEVKAVDFAGRLHTRNTNDTNREINTNIGGTIRQDENRGK